MILFLKFVGTFQNLSIKRLWWLFQIPTSVLLFSQGTPDKSSDGPWSQDLCGSPKRMIFHFYFYYWEIYSHHIFKYNDNGFYILFYKIVFQNLG